ncbi:MAG: 2OG-Fe(II) oxygenase [Bdellovibrionota bacterium]
MPDQKFLLELKTTGLGSWPNFLSPNLLSTICGDFERNKDDGNFVRAETGQGAGRSLQDLRRDETHWLSREEQNPAQAELWGKIDSLQTALNRSFFLGIQEFEGHYASYPAGGFYRRHRDSFAHDNSRIVSLVIYLNQAWQESDGGRLRVYDEASFTDIDPVGGNMVCFFSRESEHEVLESFSGRSSIAGWFKTGKSLPTR